MSLATGSSTGSAPGIGQSGLPARPGRSRFAILTGLGALVLTVLTARTIEFSPFGFISDLTRPNPVLAGLLDPDFGQLTSDRTRRAFFETLQLAVLGTVIGASLALPLSLWSTTYGNPSTWLRGALRAVNAVIRSIPELLWALLFVAAVGIGVLPGLLALIFFSIAVTTKLTADTLDAVDRGPIEAANAAGASTTTMLRTAVFPQILPAYSSFALYNFELNLRASAVLGLVGAGGVGERIEFFRGRGEWSEMWGLVLLFFLVVIVVEQVSVTLRRRLV